MCRDIAVNGITIPANSMIQAVMVEILKVFSIAQTVPKVCNSV
jgi:hypothetical protein